MLAVASSRRGVEQGREEYPIQFRSHRRQRMASNLPSYLAAARPVPQANRVPWYKSIAQTYAGVMLWYVFWRGLAGAGGYGGTLASGIWPPLVAILLGGLICHFLFYVVPGLLGMKTGLPLYVVGTSTYGAQGGLIMPGLLMGLLQFGWLGVNACMVANVLCRCFGTDLPESVAGLTAGGSVTVPNPLHAGVAVVFAVAAAFMGLKGIQYVARVASFFPLIPIAVLLILFGSTVAGLDNFKSETVRQVGRKAFSQARDEAWKEKQAAKQAAKDAAKEAAPGPASDDHDSILADTTGPKFRAMPKSPTRSSFCLSAWWSDSSPRPGPRGRTLP